MNLYILCMFFFFFKQKTAYEMRISDWSSDVCSSDLDEGNRGLRDFPVLQTCHHLLGHLVVHAGALALEPHILHDVLAGWQIKALRPLHRIRVLEDGRVDYIRSEEHTSELQSLMRISYAVFCLKKKTNEYKTTASSYERDRWINKIRDLIT